MKYEIFHSGYWETELFLAPCQPQGEIALLGFPAGLWSSPHTRVWLVLSGRTQRYVGGTGPVSGAPCLSIPASNSSHLCFSMISASSPLRGEATGLCWALVPVPGAGQLSGCLVPSLLSPITVFYCLKSTVSEDAVSDVSWILDVLGDGANLVPMVPL